MQNKHNITNPPEPEEVLLEGTGQTASPLLAPPQPESGPPYAQWTAMAALEQPAPLGSTSGNHPLL